MKIKRALICGATLLIACALGTAAHASADAQDQSNDQNNVTTELDQNSINNNSENDQNQNDSNANSAQQTNVPSNQTQTRPVRHYRRIRREVRTNYYTRVATPRRHRRGYAIYANPYGTKPNSFKPIAYQRKLSNRIVHVIREATVNNRRWINFRSKISGWMLYNGLDKSTRWLNVPLIGQRPQLPSGCEVTATAMMLRYRDGRRINKMKLAHEMPRSRNPNYGFVGSPYSSSGWWIKPHGLMGLVNRYTHHNALNMDGASTHRIINQINKGIPVVIWVGAMDGFPNHALTIYGYKRNAYMYNDPWLKRREVRSFRFLNHKRAVDALIPYGALSYKK